MARGDPHHRDGDTRQSFTIQLDSKIQIAVAPDVGQGCAVHIRNSERTHGSSGNQDAPRTHPQANGLVERFHPTMKAALKARHRNQNWMDELPWVLVGIRTAPKEDLHASSAELVYGYPLTVPGDFITPNGDQPPPSQALSQLRETVSNLLPTPQ